MRTAILSLVLALAGPATAQPFLSQYFDGADTIPGEALFVDLDTSSANVWQIGRPGKVIFNSAATQPNALVTDTILPYPVNNTSRFSFKVVPWVTWGLLAVQWKQKLDMDPHRDGGIIEYSVDAGGTWANVFNNPYIYNLYGFDAANVDTLLTGEYALSGTDTTWRDVWLCLDMSWLNFNDSIYFRYTLKSDSIDNGREGWMIDDLTAHVSFMHPVKEMAKRDYMNVYPNPARGIVNIQFEEVHDFHLIEDMRLIAPDGKLVKQWSNLPSKFWFDVGKYPDGLYMLQVKTNIRSETIPLLIKRD